MFKTYIISSFNRQDLCPEIAFPCVEAFYQFDSGKTQFKERIEKAPYNNTTKRQHNLLLFGQNEVLTLLFY